MAPAAARRGTDCRPGVPRSRPAPVERRSRGNGPLPFPRRPRVCLVFAAVAHQSPGSFLGRKLPLPRIYNADYRRQRRAGFRPPIRAASCLERGQAFSRRLARDRCSPSVGRAIARTERRSIASEASSIIPIVRLTSALRSVSASEGRQVLFAERRQRVPLLLRASFRGILP